MTCGLCRRDIAESESWCLVVIEGRVVRMCSRCDDVRAVNQRLDYTEDDE